MGTRKTDIIRTAMGRRLADKWLQTNAQPEFRITVYAGSEELRNLPSLLRAFRDGKTRIGSIFPIPDLGIDATLDRMTLWSRRKDGMVALDRWLTERGCETTGIW